MEMPKVIECDATECAYNQERKCHALAITVGDHGTPRCDTFWRAPNKGGDLNIIGGVGACRASQCRYNRSLECTASGIRVGRAGDEVDCLTFSAS